MPHAWWSCLVVDCDSLSSGITLPPCLLHRFVLRNHIAQKAIEMAEKGDYSEVSSSTDALKLACISLYKSCTPWFMDTSIFSKADRVPSPTSTSTAQNLLDSDFFLWDCVPPPVDVKIGHYINSVAFPVIIHKRWDSAGKCGLIVLNSLNTSPAWSIWITDASIFQTQQWS